MLFFRKNKYAIPTTRKLNRKIKKINKIRENYLDFCDVITNDAERFTEVMKTVHDEMIDAIKESKRVDSRFEEVYKKFADEETDIDNDLEDDDDDLRDGEIDVTEFFEGGDDDDDDYDDDEEDDEDECECKCCHHEENEVVEEDAEEDQQVIDINEVEMRNFKGIAKDLIAYSSAMMYEGTNINDVTDNFKTIGLENATKNDKADENGRFQSIFSDSRNRFKAVVIEDKDGYIGAISVMVPILTIPHGDACKKIYYDAAIGGIFKIIDGSKPIDIGANHKWYFCDIDEGDDYKNDNECVLLLGVEVAPNNRVNLTYIRSDLFTEKEINDMLK